MIYEVFLLQVFIIDNCFRTNQKNLKQGHVYISTKSKDNQQISETGLLSLQFYSLFSDVALNNISESVRLYYWSTEWEALLFILIGQYIVMKAAL
jgi:hypothetical protein